MALLTTKGIYGLCAMYQLFRSQSHKPMQIKEIAVLGHIPQNYLEQLLIRLRQAGLVKSIRGAYGGYVLAKVPQEIRIKEIIIALEGSLQVSDATLSQPVLSLFFDEMNHKLEALFDLPLSELDLYTERIHAGLDYTI